MNLNLLQQTQQSTDHSTTSSRPTVTVTRGEHGHPIPAGLGELIADELAARGVTGAYNLRMGPAVAGTGAMAAVKVVRVTARGTVELRCKPGSNDTARVCWLSLPMGTSTRDAVAEAEKLAAVLRTPVNKGGMKMATGTGFTAHHDNIQATLKVLCASGARDKFILAHRAKRALIDSGVGPGMTSASWGQVFGTLNRKGYLDVRRSGEDLVAVRVPEKHVPREMSNGHAQKLGVEHVLAAKPAAITLPSVIDRDGLASWLKQLAGIEEGLLQQLVSAEEVERQAHEAHVKAKGEADVVREQLAKAGSAVAAAKLLLEVMQ